MRMFCDFAFLFPPLVRTCYGKTALLIVDPSAIKQNLFTQGATDR